MDMNEPLLHIHPLVWKGEDERDVRALFIRDLVVPAHIGVYPQEQGRAQPLRFDLCVYLQPPFEWHDRLDEVLDYDQLRQGILDIVGAGHINLLETLAERIVALCFGYRQVQGVHLKIAKLEAHRDCVVGYETRRKR
jgi:dihydroneopterin aldolase